MKILELNLKAFGPFTNHQLDLSSGQHGLHLIYGPNEAGKSSTLRAIRQMFYGIPVQSSDNFQHAYQKLRIGATLQDSTGQQLTFLRRKGNLKTLLAADDSTAIDDSLLSGFLQNISEDVFCRMFGINHRDLIHGGKDIIDGQGELGQLLFLAGSGISHLQTIQNEFKKESDRLFKPSGSVPVINKGITEWNQYRREIREHQLSGDAWTDLVRQSTEKKDRRETVEEELKTLQGKLHRCTRIQNVLPQIAELLPLRMEAKAYEHTIILPEQFSAQRQNITTELKIQQSQATQATEHLEQIKSSLEELSFPEDLLIHAEQINDFYLDLGSHRKALTDTRDRQIERNQFELDAKSLLKEVRPDLTIDKAEQLRLTRPQRVRIQELGRQHDVLKTEQKNGIQSSDRIHRRLTEIETQLAECPSERDPQPLHLAIREAQQHPQLEAQIHESEKTIRKTKQQLTRELKKLAGWSGELSDLETLAVPAEETIDRFESELNHSQREIQQLCQRIDEEEQELREINRQLEQLRREGEIPTEQQLHESRNTRQQLWKTIKAAWLKAGKQQSVSEKQSKASLFDPESEDRELAENYEQTVSESDEISDRLRREAQQVERQATLQAENQKQLEQLARLKEKLAEQRTEFERQQREWSELWEALQVVPLSPMEMRGWKNQQQKLIQQLETERQQTEQLESLNAICQKIRAELLAALQLTQIEIDDSLPLQKLLQEAEQRLSEMQECNRQREQLTKELDEQNQELLEANDQNQQIEKELTDWQNQWAEDMQQLGLSVSATPSEASEFLAVTDDLFRKLTDIDKHDERLAGMSADAASFAKRVEEFLRKLPAEFQHLSGGTLEEIVPELNHQLHQAKADQERYEELHLEQKSEEQRLQQLKQQIRELEIKLGELCTQAGCDSAEELPEAEKNSQESVRIRDRIQELERQIVQHSAGASLEEFIAEARAVNADELRSEVPRLEQEIRERERERDELIDQTATLREELKRMDGSAAAATAAEESESLAAQLEQNVETWVRVKLAGEILKRGMERYRQKHQGPVLERASELFRLLTLNSFSGLKVDFHEDGTPQLVGIRAENEQPVTVSGMSEGSCDQLYLALRLAGLEGFLDQHEPLPFIIDDLLVNFDNPRSIAALQALAELSAKTQVIFFTHHEHLLELAEAHLSAGQLIIHRLKM